MTKNTNQVAYSLSNQSEFVKKDMITHFTIIEVKYAAKKYSGKDIYFVQTIIQLLATQSAVNTMTKLIVSAESHSEHPILNALTANAKVQLSLYCL